MDWTVENAHHRVMDMALGEDDSHIRTGHAAYNSGLSTVPQTARDIHAYRETTRIPVGANPVCH